MLPVPSAKKFGNRRSEVSRHRRSWGGIRTPGEEPEHRVGAEHGAVSAVPLPPACPLPAGSRLKQLKLITGPSCSPQPPSPLSPPPAAGNPRGPAAPAACRAPGAAVATRVCRRCFGHVRLPRCTATAFHPSEKFKSSKACVRASLRGFCCCFPWALPGDGEGETSVVSQEHPGKDAHLQPKEHPESPALALTFRPYPLQNSLTLTLHIWQTTSTK